MTKKEQAENGQQSLTLMIETALHLNLKDILEDEGYIYEILKEPNPETGRYYQTDCPKEKISEFHNKAIDEVIEDIKDNKAIPKLIKASIKRQLKKSKI